MNQNPDSTYFVRLPDSAALNVALVAGPMYDPLYEMLPEFKKKSGLRVHVAARLVHPELNAHLAEVYQAGTGAYDLIFNPQQVRSVTRAFPASAGRLDARSGA